MNNNLEFENEDPSPDSIEDNHPRTNYGEGYGGKETLEEVAETWNEHQTTLEFGKPHNAPNRIKAFIAGAKWQQEHYGLMEIELSHTKTLLASCEKALEERDKQQERMYSKEEVFNLCREFAIFVQRKGPSYKKQQEWFEEFKKK